MPTIEGSLTVPTQTGVGPATGIVHVTPYPRRQLTADESSRLPAPTMIRLVDGEFSMYMEETDAFWCYVVYEETQVPRTRYVSVRDALTTNYHDLEEVDPRTFDPLVPIPPSAQEILNKARAVTKLAHEAVNEAGEVLPAARKEIRQLTDIAIRSAIEREGAINDAVMTEVAGDDTSSFHASLSSTIATETDRIVPGKVAEAIAADDMPAQAAAAAATTAVAHEVSARSLVEGATGINRILHSTNPQEPLQDGDLLIVLPARFFTDFSEYPTGEAPHDWSMKWVDDNVYTVVADAEGTGGALLREGSATSPNRALGWDAVGRAADAEVVFKWRTTNRNAPPRAIVRGAGDQAAPTGYHAGVQNESTRSIQAAVASTSSVDLATESASTEENTWYITRLRVEGDQQMMRTWLAAEPEPDTWDLESTDASIPDPGWVGIRTYSDTSTRDFDWFGVGIDGHTAPTGAL